MSLGLFEDTKAWRFFVEEKKNGTAQMKNVKDTSTLKEFAKYVSANVIAMIGLSCYILADTFFISLKMGQTGLAALNLSSPSFNIVFSIGMMFAVGGGTKFAIHKGAKNDDEANKVFTHTVLIVAIFAVAFLLLGIFASRPVAMLLGAEGDTLDYSNTYVQIILCFAPFFMYSNVFQSFVRNDGAPRLAMIASLSGNLFNIVFDYVLVFPCNLDMLGAALATGFSPIFSILVLSLHVIRKKNTFHFRKTKLSARTYGGICSLGLAPFINEISFATVLTVFNGLFKRLGGDTAIAAYTIVINVFYVVNSIFNGVANGTQPMISFSYGESDHKKIRQVLRYALITVSSLAVILYTAIFFGADGITSIFNTQGVEALQQEATQGMRLFFLMALFSGLNLLFSYYFSASDRGAYAQLITLLRGLVTIIPIAYLFSYLWKMTGLWLATPAAELLTLTVTLTLFFLTRPKKTELIPCPEYKKET